MCRKSFTFECNKVQESMLQILYQDDHLIAINKPTGLLVHPSRMAADADESAMQILRDQIGQWVYPIHRLDRKTSGVLLFALDKEMQSKMSAQFRDGEVGKDYLAIVRGYLEEHGEIDYELTNEKGKVQTAFTKYETLEQTEIPLAFGKYETSRYSLVRLMPSTGRFHQLRKHMAHIFHPIIGDRPHGCNKQNKLFKEHFAMEEMMLHASTLRVKHPLIGKEILIEAPLQDTFRRMIEALKFSASGSRLL